MKNAQALKYVIMKTFWQAIHADLGQNIDRSASVFQQENLNKFEVVSPFIYRHRTRKYFFNLIDGIKLATLDQIMLTVSGQELKRR